MERRKVGRGGTAEFPAARRGANRPNVRDNLPGNNDRFAEADDRYGDGLVALGGEGAARVGTG
jgi:hypothetical protein